jgi:tetratricopeptide (TPR) repeat protein
MQPEEMPIGLNASQSYVSRRSFTGYHLRYFRRLVALAAIVAACLCVIVVTSCSKTRQDLSPAELDKQIGRSFAKGDYAQALRDLDEAAANTREVAGKESPQYAWCLFLKAKSLLGLGRYAEGDSLMFVADQLMAKFPSCDSLRAHLLYICAIGVTDETRFRAAEMMLERAIDVQLMTLSVDNRDLLLSRKALAQYLFVKRDFESAIPIYQEVLASNMREPGDDSGVAEVSSDLSACFLVLGQTDSAVAISRRSFGRLNSDSGVDRRFAAGAALDLARIYGKSRDYATAEKWSDSALGLAERSKNLARGDLVPFLDSRAAYSMQVGKLDQAELFCRRALAVLESEYGSQDTLTASQMMKCAIICRRLDKQTEAEELESQAGSILDSARLSH